MYFERAREMYLYFERAREKAMYNSKFIFNSEIVRIWTDPKGRGREEMQ